MNDGGGFQPVTEQIHQRKQIEAKAEAEQDSLKKLGSRREAAKVGA